MYTVKASFVLDVKYDLFLFNLNEFLFNLNEYFVHRAEYFNRILRFVHISVVLFNKLQQIRMLIL